MSGAFHVWASGAFRIALCYCVVALRWTGQIRLYLEVE